MLSTKLNKRTYEVTNTVVDILHNVTFSIRAKEHEYIRYTLLLTFNDLMTKHYLNMSTLEAVE